MKASLSSWGPSAWTFLHTISFVYPDSPSPSDRSEMESFLRSFSDVIPCGKCKKDFKEMISTLHPSTFDSRDSLSRYIVHLHNRVNLKLGKKTRTYDSVLREYTKDNPFLSKASLLTYALLFSSLCYLAFLSSRKRSGRVP